MVGYLDYKSSTVGQPAFHSLLGFSHSTMSLLPTSHDQQVLKEEQNRSQDVFQHVGQRKRRSEDR